MWTRQNIQKIILDFSLKASNNPFNGVASLYKKDNADWKDDIGLDSIELMQLSAYVNSFFNLFEMKDPPYLLSSAKLDDWVELVFDAKQKSNEYLNFTTSGTSGQSKTGDQEPRGAGAAATNRGHVRRGTAGNAGQGGLLHQYFP